MYILFTYNLTNSQSKIYYFSMQKIMITIFTMTNRRKIHFFPIPHKKITIWQKYYMRTREKQHLDSTELIDRLGGSDASISRHEGVEKFIFAKNIFKKWRHSVSVTRGVAPSRAKWIDSVISHSLRATRLSEQQLFFGCWRFMACNGSLIVSFKWYLI